MYAKSAQNISQELQNLLRNPNVPLIFLFNGADCQNIWQTMELHLPSDGCIHGHPVCVLHCRSDELTKWQIINAMRADIRDKDAEIRDKDTEIRDKDTEIRDKDAEIRDKDTEILLLKQELDNLR